MRLGDVLELSRAQVDQELQDLRGEDLIAVHGDCLEVLNWEGLQKAGEFDPAYLHLKKKEAF
jgi:hypothetical protein